jgi:hypothetical protein
MMVEPMRDQGGGPTAPYYPAKMRAITDLVHEHGLRGSLVRELLYSVMALLTGNDVAACKAAYDLPSATTQWRSHHMTSAGLRDELHAYIGGSRGSFMLEIDEGTKNRIKYLIILATMRGGERFFVAAPDVYTTSAEVSVSVVERFCRVA